MSQEHFPEPIVGAFILNGEGKLLLLKSHKWHNVLIVPGGHIEIGETIKNAISREVAEETGQTVTSVRFLTVSEFIHSSAFYKKKHFICLNYEVFVEQGSVTLNKEAEEYLWVYPKDALTLPMLQVTRDIIQNFLIKKSET